MASNARLSRGELVHISQPILTLTLKLTLTLSNPTLSCRLNDHSHIDHRFVKLWPMVPRDFLLRHVGIELEKKPIAQKSPQFAPRSPSSKETPKQQSFQSQAKSNAKAGSVFLKIFASYTDENKFPVGDEVIRAHTEGMWVVKETPGSNYTDVTYLLTMDPKGLIPEWLINMKLESSLMGLVEMKKQLETTSLEAQKLTYVERIHKLERRLAIKWNQESFVEKATIILGAVVAMLVIEGLQVSERSERALMKTRILAMNPVKWLHYTKGYIHY